MEFDIGHIVYIIANMLFSTVLSKTLSERNEKKNFGNLYLCGYKTATNEQWARQRIVWIGTEGPCIMSMIGPVKTQHNTEIPWKTMLEQGTYNSYANFLVQYPKPLLPLP